MSHHSHTCIDAENERKTNEKARLVKFVGERIIGIVQNELKSIIEGYQFVNDTQNVVTIDSQTQTNNDDEAGYESNATDVTVKEKSSDENGAKNKKKKKKKKSKKKKGKKEQNNTNTGTNTQHEQRLGPQQQQQQHQSDHLQGGQSNVHRQQEGTQTSNHELRYHRIQRQPFYGDFVSSRRWDNRRQLHQNLVNRSFQRLNYVDNRRRNAQHFDNCCCQKCFDDYERRYEDFQTNKSQHKLICA
ncbi:protein kinase 4-like [Contarinia nasturtii]|uniref:protein kinase 4-like n=1 Tax=Contarinia nasturtii TaxID=265458 RepID=UPI0012D3DD2C|nr:protein kinase 4-like [Contarinia nasturtii]